MTRMSIRELVESWRPRYIGASREEKTNFRATRAGFAF